MDVLDPSEEATAGGYRERAIEVLKELREAATSADFHGGDGTVFARVVGGSGGRAAALGKPLRERLRTARRNTRRGICTGCLRRLDPVSAEKIAAADEQKLIRAIEVCLLAKKPLSEVQRSGRKPLEGWRAMKIGLQPET